MRKIIVGFIFSVVLFSCDNQSQNKYLNYQNIVILTDMSSRLDNKAFKDIGEIHKIVQFFRNECVKPGEKIGDKSSIAFSTFSGNIDASIDIDKIKGLGAKQQFINSTGEYKGKGLDSQIDFFEQSVKNVYQNTRNQGLDLISILIDKIDTQPIIKKNTFLSDGVDTTFINYDNHIYIFTDGYLEYQNKENNKQFYFGNDEIERVRQFCQSNQVDVNTALQNNRELCLPSFKNSKNQSIHLHILETHERDKDEKLQTYKYPKGLRDNEILEAVWRKWAKDSGFKSLEWKRY